ncbi:MAG TPA: isoprenylcysteine carboxylmethyltransferase family protein [Stellaceae bacterium]|nr:isoprenylcysteine carboxylmethyltransferase family protein [Stellaceae bacterium]
MSQRPPVAMDEVAPFAGDGLLGAPRGAAILEALAHRAVMLWFMLLAANLAFGLVKSALQFDAAALDTIALATIADMLSRFFTMAFFIFAAWLTLVRSPPVAKAPGLMPRLVALLAVTMLLALPFLPRLEPAPTWLLFLSAGLAFLGNALALIALNWLGRSFSVMSEARRLVTAGPYRCVRHPLYLTEEIAIIGIFLPYWSWQAALLFFAHLALQLLRLNNEERVLRQTFADYADYARRTARLIPGLW